MARTFLIRYGLEHRTGWFVADDPLISPERDEPVIIQTHRGLELGRVLFETARAPEGATTPAPDGPGRILRTADEDDLRRSASLELERSQRFESCRACLADGVWPIELIDAEPLLEDNRTVLHYLGPHRLETAGLRAALLERCGLDVWLEAVGADVPDDILAPADDHLAEDHGCGSCGSSGGGGCGSSSGGGCGSCAVKDLIAKKPARPHSPASSPIG